MNLINQWARMKEELYGILDERAKLRVASFPLAIALSLGLHLAVVAIFLWSTRAGSPPPRGQALNQEGPLDPSVAAGTGMGATAPETLPATQTPILAGVRPLPAGLPSLAGGIPAVVHDPRPKPRSGLWQRHRKPRA